jgi:hypothetical protein
MGGGSDPHSWAGYLMGHTEKMYKSFTVSLPGVLA